MIDLHAHTTASDGSLTPTELVALAKEVGLSTVAVTDHDTIRGVAEAEAAAREAGIGFVPGIEISVDHRPGQFHLLGLFVDHGQPGFRDRIDFLQDSRANRNVKMIEKMQAAGLPITLEDVRREAGSDQLGRPNMAMALVRKGIVGSVQEAFDTFLADGGPCHVPKVKLGPAEAIEMVHAAGGLAIMAHPKFLRVPDLSALALHLEQFKELGLDGIEAYYSAHTPEETAAYLELARRFEFLVSAGSDFHGTPKPHVHLGRIYEGRAGDDRILSDLQAALAARRGALAGV